jgi:hypothetical protein
MRNHIAGIALAMALAMGVQGCYGSFTLTRKLYHWNGEFEPAVKEGIFLVTGVILPIYGIAVFVDAIVLNSIEFWGGQNPLAQVVTQGDKKLVIKGDPATGLVHVVAYENGKETGQMLLKRTATGIAAMDPANNDQVLYSVRVVSDNQAYLADASGAMVAHPVQ